MPDFPLFRSPATSDGQALASPRFGSEDAFGPGDYGSDDGDNIGAYLIVAINLTPLSCGGILKMFTVHSPRAALPSYQFLPDPMSVCGIMYIGAQAIIFQD